MPDFISSLDWLSTGLSMFFELIQYVCTLLIIFYILFQAGVLHRIERSDKMLSSVKDTIIITVLFGILGIVATIDAYPINGVFANVRDLPAAIAGMLGGPVAGIGTGLIAGLYRLSVPGITNIPCSIAAFLAGVFGGIVYLVMRGKFIRPLFAAIYAGLFELFHMSLVILIPGANPDPWGTVQSVVIPMTVANSFGLFIFSFMVHRALNYRSIKAKKDKIEAELKTAREIQESMLPRIFPPFPNRKEFDVFACMNPAKDVGGDFYDFFLVGENKLCFLVGDVSDKGVPAALFMTIVKTLLKTEAMRGCPPQEVLRRVNEILYPDNESCSFVTVFCGILDIGTGEMEYSNGGHLPPFVLSAPSGLTLVPMDKNFMVGNMPALVFSSQKLRLMPGDFLFLYTDGATEASNPGREMFTGKRLTNALSEVFGNGKDVRGIIEGVLGKIKEFAGEAEQYDDITLMAIHFTGARP
jgi:sigma-B regulation protein RsbU (phosphoserine phosphatase)